MVMIQFVETEDTLHFSCRGHAGYATAGQPDIVCAAVSALSMTLCNALIPEAGFGCKVRVGDVFLCCDKTSKAQIIFDAIAIGFHGLMVQYPAHVQIKDTRERPLEGEPYVHI